MGRIILIVFGICMAYLGLQVYKKQGLREKLKGLIIILSGIAMVITGIVGVL